MGSGAKRRGGYRSRRGEIPIESAVESYPKLAPGGVLVEGGSCEEGTHLHSQAGPIWYLFRRCKACASVRLKLPLPPVNVS